MPRTPRWVNLIQWRRHRRRCAKKLYRQRNNSNWCRRFPASATPDCRAAAAAVIVYDTVFAFVVFTQPLDKPVKAPTQTGESTCWNVIAVENFPLMRRRRLVFPEDDIQHETSDSLVFQLKPKWNSSPYFSQASRVIFLFSTHSFGASISRLEARKFIYSYNLSGVRKFTQSSADFYTSLCHVTSGATVQSRER